MTLNRQRRILVVGPSPPPHHGVSIMTELTVRALRDAGYEVRLADTADRRDLANIGRLDVRNVAHGLWHAAQIWKTAVRWRPAAVLFPVSQAALPFLRDALWMCGPALVGSRLVLVLHGAFFGAFYRQAPCVLRAIVRWHLRRVGRVVVLCPSAVSNFDGLIPPNRISVVPNAVPALDGGASRRDPAKFRVLYLGNRIRGKGYLDLIEAAGILRGLVGELEVVVAGESYDVPVREEDALIARLGVERVVRRTGVVLGHDKAALLASADVLVLPTTLQEGQPLVLLEAMAAGLPIVTTTRGCVPETVEEGVNAVLVAPGDVAGLARALLSLWRDPMRRRALGQRSRELWSERYRPEVFRENLTDVLVQLGIG